MPLILTIPDELIEAIKLPKGRLESELKKELKEDQNYAKGH